MKPSFFSETTEDSGKHKFDSPTSTLSHQVKVMFFLSLVCWIPNYLHRTKDLQQESLVRTGLSACEDYTLTANPNSNSFSEHSKSVSLSAGLMGASLMLCFV